MLPRRLLYGYSPSLFHRGEYARLVKGRVANKLTTPAKKFFLRSPNGAACPSPKPHRASRRRLAASAGCARRPPLSAGELGATSGGGAGATGWGGRLRARPGKACARGAGGGRTRAGGTASKVALFFLYSVGCYCAWIFPRSPYRKAHCGKRRQ
jgi:hypothetical protein